MQNLVFVPSLTGNGFQKRTFTKNGCKHGVMMRFVGVVYFCLTFDRGGGWATVSRAKTSDGFQKKISHSIFNVFISLSMYHIYKFVKLKLIFSKFMLIRT